MRTYLTYSQQWYFSNFENIAETLTVSIYSTLLKTW